MLFNVGGFAGKTCRVTCPNGSYFTNIKSKSGITGTETFVKQVVSGEEYLVLKFEDSPVGYPGRWRDFTYGGSPGYLWVPGGDFEDNDRICQENKMAFINKQTGQIEFTFTSDNCSWIRGPYDITTPQGLSQAENAINLDGNNQFFIPKEWYVDMPAALNRKGSVWLAMRVSGWAPFSIKGNMNYSKGDFAHREMYTYLQAGGENLGDPTGKGMGNLLWMSWWREQRNGQLYLMRYGFDNGIFFETKKVVESPDMCSMLGYN